MTLNQTECPQRLLTQTEYAFVFCSHTDSNRIDMIKDRSHQLFLHIVTNAFIFNDWTAGTALTLTYATFLEST